MTDPVDAPGATTGPDQAARDTGAGDTEARETAARVAAHLDTIRQALHQAVVAEAQRRDLPLTGPQLQAMEVVVERTREAGAGPSLSDLSERMRLAHSTVSGIVSRLERRGLLRRVPQPEDRRAIRIEVTDEVRSWLHRDLPAVRTQPLATALAGATAEERAAVLRGLAVLERLVTTPT